MKKEGYTLSCIAEAGGEFYAGPAGDQWVLAARLPELAR